MNTNPASDLSELASIKALIEQSMRKLCAHADQSASFVDLPFGRRTFVKNGPQTETVVNTKELAGKLAIWAVSEPELKTLETQLSGTNYNLLVVRAERGMGVPHVADIAHADTERGALMKLRFKVQTVEAMAAVINGHTFHSAQDVTAVMMLVGEDKEQALGEVHAFLKSADGAVSSIMEEAEIIKKKFGTMGLGKPVALLPPEGNASAVALRP